MAKREKHSPKHEKPRQCGFTWTTKPVPGIPASMQHTTHSCVYVPGHRGGHACNNWNCAETY